MSFLESSTILQLMQLFWISFQLVQHVSWHSGSRLRWIWVAGFALGCDEF